jgi:tetratricopeptide (TPR) repeat protein
MKARAMFVMLVLAHGFLLLPFSTYLAKRPLEIKLGYVPHPQLLKVTVADQALLVAEMAVIKVLFYYGTLVDKYQKNVIVRPENANMYRTLVTATQLDPYNMDAYYFAEAAFTWELKRFAEVNELLEYGIKYRKWDSWLYFYLGFNNSYFLKDYGKGARYLQRAAELSNNPLFTKLAARYYYESEQTDLGLAFLDSMIAQAKDKAVKRTYEVRRDALRSVSQLEKAVSAFRSRTNRPPHDLDELVRTGLLDRIPTDPYGGSFYLDDKGRVRSTSKFANQNL